MIDLPVHQLIMPVMRHCSQAGGATRPGRVCWGGRRGGGAEQRARSDGRERNGAEASVNVRAASVN